MGHVHSYWKDLGNFPENCVWFALISLTLNCCFSKCCQIFLVMPFTCAIKEIKTDSTFLVELMMGFNLFSFKKYNNRLLMQEQYQKQLYD